MSPRFAPLQDDLFSAAASPARNSDPETSHMASVHDLSRLVTHRMKALAALVNAGASGLTDFELAEVVHVPQTSVGKRRLELERAGLVERNLFIDPDTLTLIPAYRPSPTGSRAIVWCANEAGRTFLRDNMPEAS